MKKNKGCYAGYTLLELLLALAVGSWIIHGLLQTYLHAQQQFLFQQRQSSAITSIALWRTLVTPIWQEGGFMPCEGKNLTPMILTPGVAVHHATDKAAKTQFPEPIQRNLVIENDLLEIRRAIPFAQLRQNTTPGTLLQLSLREKLHPEDRLLLSDCRYQAFITVQKVIPLIKQGIQVIIFTPAVLYSFPAHTWIGRWEQSWWYIGQASSGYTSLYVWKVGDMPEELIPGIKSLAIEKLTDHQLHISANFTGEHADLIPNAASAFEQKFTHTIRLKA